MDLLFYVSIHKKLLPYISNVQSIGCLKTTGITKSNSESSITLSIILLHLLPVYPQSLMDLIINRLVLDSESSLDSVLVWIIWMIASHGKFGYSCSK